MSPDLIAPSDTHIEDALRQIHDPCSIAARTPVDIMAMGLVRGWFWSNGRLEVKMCVTAISCTMAPHFLKAAESELAKLDGVLEVDVQVDYTITWTEDMMEEAARERLARRRAEAKSLVRPQQWRAGGPRQSAEPA
jgi:metal-sulfur cluster biosynthetic enzyme